MSSFRELPLSARLVVFGYVALGAFGVLLRVPEMRTWSWEDVAATVGLALAAALSEQFTVAMRHRTEVENFSVTDAVWVPALILVSPSVLTISVLLGSLAGHAYRRWAWYKVAFNAGQFVVAITVAEFVYRLFDLPSSFSFMTCVASAVAMSCYFAINEISVALIISRVEGIPLREVVVLPGGLNLLHAGGNLTIGMLAALVWHAGPIGLPLLIAPVVLSFFAYRGWLQNKREEEQRREGDRMRTLYEAGRALVGPLDAHFDFQPFLGLVQQLVDAAGAELAVRDEAGLRVYNSESGLYLTVQTEMSPEDPTAYVGSQRTSPPSATRRTRSGSSPSTAPPSCLRRNARWSTRWLHRSPRDNGTRTSSTRRSSNVAIWRTWSAAARTASSWSPERARCSRGTRRWRRSPAT
jgi:hypothetical protein